MAWEEESIQLDHGEPSGNKKNILKLALLGAGALVVIVGLYFLLSYLFSSSKSEDAAVAESKAQVEAPAKAVAEPESETSTVAEPVDDFPDAEGLKIDLERFVVRLEGAQGGGYVVFDASIWVVGETQRDALGGSEPDDALTVKVRQYVFNGISGLTQERAQDRGELRELASRLRLQLEGALGKNTISQVSLQARAL